MKIVFATEYYRPFTPGGTPWSLELLAQALGRRGHQVAVVTPNYGAAPREEVDGVAVFRFPFWRRLDPGPGLAPVRDHVNPLFHWRMARAVTAAARRVGADAVHAQEKHALVGAYLAARRLGLPVFLTLRDYGLICPITTCLLGDQRIPGDCGARKLQRACAPFYLDRYIGPGRWRRLRVRASLACLYADARLKQVLVRRLDGVVGVSRSVLDIYGGAGCLSAGRSHVVYNLPPPASEAAVPGSRSERLARLGLPDGPLVLYVGKLSLGKGFPTFVEAARALGRSAPGVAFAAAGAGDATSASAAPVRLLGARRHDEVRALYDLADVVVQPALWPEPFSRVLLEAAAAGRAVVATRAGGTPEAVLDEETGLLVERGSATELGRAIARLLGDDRLREDLGRRAAQSVARRFGADAVVSQLLAAYRSALG